MDLDNEEFESTRKLHERLRRPDINKALEIIRNYNDYNISNSDLIEALDTIIDYFKDINQEITHE